MNDFEIGEIVIFKDHLEDNTLKKFVGKEAIIISKGIHKVRDDVLVIKWLDERLNLILPQNFFFPCRFIKKTHNDKFCKKNKKSIL